MKPIFSPDVILKTARMNIKLLFPFIVAGTVFMISESLKAQINPIHGSNTYEYIGTFSKNKLDSIVSVEIDAFMYGSPTVGSYKDQFLKSKYPLKLYKISYRTYIPEKDNRPVIATGLVAIPETGTKKLPLVSYQHGTIFTSNEVPSQPDKSYETKLILSQMGGQGFIVMGADYIGRGESDLPDSYAVKGSAQQAGLDMYLATLDFLKQMGYEVDKTFLAGWSQGGWNTLQYYQKFLSLDILPTAVGVASGPMDSYIAFNRWVNNVQPGDAPYMTAIASLFLSSYEYYYGLDGLVNSAIKPEYVAAARDFYHNKIDWSTFVKRATIDTKSFFNPSFLESVNRTDVAFWQKLRDAQGYVFRSKTPFRYYSGGKDEVTPAELNTLSELAQKMTGGVAPTLIYTHETADHRGVFVLGVIDMQQWFSSFLNK
jgi:pimeloyl-ACP methyl ester carboxylesterase